MIGYSSSLHGPVLNHRFGGRWRAAEAVRQTGSPWSVGQGGFHLCTRVQRSQDLDRGNCRAGEFRRDIVGYAGETQHVDLERLPRRADLLQVLAREVPQAKIQGLAGNRLPGRLGMTLELVADCGADEVGAVE